MYKRGLAVWDAKIGLVSNNKDLIYNKDYFELLVPQSILTNIYKVEEVDFNDVDAYMYVIDEKGLEPSVVISDKAIYAAGDFTALEAEAADIRYSLFGNLGLIFKQFLVTLERKDIYSFHASAMYNEKDNELYLIVGSAGAGKTVYLLAMFMRGYKLFSTEMTHVKFTADGPVFYKGALFDNIRIGNLVYDFPGVDKILGVEIPEVKDVWGTKIALDFGKSATAFDTIVNPKVSLIFPRIEAGRDQAIVSDVKNKAKMKKMLFDNASEKLNSTFLMYEKIAVPSLDTPELMAKREIAMARFVNEVNIRQAKSILAGSKNCMEGVE